MDTQVKEIYNNEIDGTNKDFQEWLKGKLKSELDGMRVIFTKKDGSERELKCTLHEDAIPADKKPKGTTTVVRSTEALPVFDLENKEWRSFRWDSLINVKYVNVMGAGHEISTNW